MTILIWCFTGLLLLLWTLSGWALHTLLTAGPAWLGRLPARLQEWPTAALLDRWWPGWQDSLVLAADTLQLTFGWMEGLGGVVVWLLWAVWAVGTLLSLALAGLLTVAVRRLPAMAANVQAAARPSGS